MIHHLQIFAYFLGNLDLVLNGGGDLPPIFTYLAIFYSKKSSLKKSLKIETPKNNKIKFYYENHMSKNAELYEKILKNIIKRRTKYTSLYTYRP